HRAHLWPRLAVPRPCPRALHRGRAARRWRLAAGDLLARATRQPPLAALSPEGTAPSAEGSTPAHAPTRFALPQVSRRLRRQPHQPLPPRPAGGGLLLPLHRSAAAVGASPGSL